MISTNNPAHIAVRRAVREALAGLDDADLVLVGCSGGGDSLALAVALAYVARRDGRLAGAVSVDHGLQDGSADRARTVGAQLAALGLDPVEVVHVRVDDTAHGGPEGNARRVRYAALDAAARRHTAAAILLGHTRDDQAETVLLGLARGSGARSLAGMADVVGSYRRPLLRLPRAVVRASLPDDVEAWDDPHNADPSYARARVRHGALPALEADLGPGVGAALARTAGLLRADADALDDWTEHAFTDCVIIGSSRLMPPESADDHRLDVAKLLTYPQAVRWRVLRRASIAAGSPPTDLTAAHVEAVDALVTHWHGQIGVDLPGRLRASRSGKELRLSSRDTASNPDKSPGGLPDSAGVAG